MLFQNELNKRIARDLNKKMQKGYPFREVLVKQAYELIEVNGKPREEAVEILSRMVIDLVHFANKETGQKGKSLITLDEVLEKTFTDLGEKK